MSQVRYFGFVINVTLWCDINFPKNRLLALIQSPPFYRTISTVRTVLTFDNIHEAYNRLQKTVQG